VDWKAEYSALSSTRSQKKKLKQLLKKQCLCLMSAVVCGTVGE